MPSLSHHRRLAVAYVIQVLLLLISGLLLLANQPLFGVLLLIVATILNVRILSVQKRYAGKSGQ